MGRRKKNKHRNKPDREQDFYDTVDFLGITLPHQLKNWQRFFISKERFLNTAERWLSMRIQGRHLKIEDDIDKGLMPHRPYIPPPVVQRQHKKSWWSQFSDDEYGWPYHQTAIWKPRKPVIAEPSGLSGALLVAL